MNVLLDTHSFLWFIEGRSNLSRRALDIIEDTETNVYLSIVSLWEMSIKYSLGKLTVAGGTGSFEDVIDHHIRINVIDILGLKQSHVMAVASLPHHHHRDPFDRLLVVQSRLEGLPLLSSDVKMDLYGANRIW